MTISNLQTSYQEAIHTLIPLTEELRTPGSRLKINDLNSIFEHSRLWVSSNSASGHKKFRHTISRIVVEYQGHNSRSDRTMQKDIQNQVLEQIQLHLNFLCNDVFKYTVSHWKTLPDFQASLRNLQTVNS